MAFKRKGKEVLVELHGDESGDEFSDWEDDYERIVAAVRQKVTNYISMEDTEAENIEHLVSELGKFKLKL